MEKKLISLHYTIESLRLIVDTLIRNKQYGHELNTYKELLEEMVQDRFHLLYD